MIEKDLTIRVKVDFGLGNSSFQSSCWGYLVNVTQDEVHVQCHNLAAQSSGEPRGVDRPKTAWLA